MGQVSLPVLNRTGYTMFWSSTWDNLSNFQKNFKQDILLRRLVPFFFSNPIFETSFFFKRDLISLNSTIRIGSWQKNNPFTDVNLESIDIFYNSNVRPTYFNKIWIFRFRGWVVVFVLFFHASFNVLDFSVLRLFLEKKFDKSIFLKKRLLLRKVHFIWYASIIRSSFLQFNNNKIDKLNF